MKKAVFFTLGLTLFAFIVLSLSFLFADNSSRYDERFAELVSINRVYDLDASLQTSFSKIFSAKSGMSYTASTTEAIFQHNLPLDYTTLNNEYQNFKNFAQAEDKHIIIDALPRNISLKISEVELIYWQNIIKNISYFTPTNKNPTSYSFLLDFFETNISSCNSSSSASGGFFLSVAATGGNSTTCNLTLSIDPSQQASVGVNLAGSNALTIQFSNYVASVEAINNNVSVTSRVKYATTAIKPKIELDSKINITIPNLIARRYGNIRIA